MDRTYPYEPDAYCDDCGCLGAFDVMGDYYCSKCLELNLRNDDTDDMDNWNEED
jgi:hypothetical protein